MKAKVVWSDKALYDLEDAFDFLSLKSVGAAERMVDRIIKKIELLEELPYLGAIETRLLTKSKIYRYLVVGHHKVIYREDAGIIWILRIFDTGQNPDRLNL